MNKLLFYLSILSLLTIGSSFQSNKTNSTLSQSTGYLRTINPIDQNFKDIMLYNTKEGWFNCLNSRKIRSCENEQPFLSDKADLDNAISKKMDCILFDQHLQTSKDQDYININYFNQCYYDTKLNQIAVREECLLFYFAEFTNCSLR